MSATKRQVNRKDSFEALLPRVLPQEHGGRDVHVQRSNQSELRNLYAKSNSQYTRNHSADCKRPHYPHHQIGPVLIAYKCTDVPIQTSSSRSSNAGIPPFSSPNSKMTFFGNSNRSNITLLEACSSPTSVYPSLRFCCK